MCGSSDIYVFENLKTLAEIYKTTIAKVTPIGSRIRGRETCAEKISIIFHSMMYVFCVIIRKAARGVRVKHAYHRDNLAIFDWLISGVMAKNKCLYL